MRYIGSDNDPRYARVQERYANYHEQETLIYKVVDSLLDLPRDGYTPFDYGARADLMRLIYYDDRNPFAKPLPTPKQKKSLIFNPDRSDNPPDVSKGYRIFLQSRAIEPQERMKTQVHISLGMERPDTDLHSIVELIFVIITGANYEDLVDENGIHRSRTYCIASRIKRALNGVNIAGVGTISYSRKKQTTCGMVEFQDNYFNIGYILTMCCEFMD